MVEAARPALIGVDMSLDALGREAGASLMGIMAGRGRAAIALLARHSRFVRSAARDERKRQR
jgi:hypothetical protein